jgi:hypothetical protein
MQNTAENIEIEKDRIKKNRSISI